MAKKILIVEDDKAIVRLLTVALKTSDYEVLCAVNGIDAISLFLANNPDLVLLDMGLPDIDGSEVLEQIRDISSTPIIIVSARGREEEKVYALDHGANDYVTKPFNIQELLARIRVAFRLNKINKEEVNEFSCNGLFVNFDKHIVKINDNEVHLTPIEFKLLKLLIENKGKVLTHSFIQKAIWDYESEDEYQSLRTYMATLRRKIEANNQKYIITEVGVGYRFID